jgi:cytoskeletal protein RodZ
MRAGAKLRAAREAMHVSLEHVAAKLMIRADYVAALEAMNVNLIPGKAYARAYLRSYVKFLGLPEEEIVAQYENESARLREDASDQIRNPESKPARERPWLAALLLAVVCAAFVGWRALRDGDESEKVQTAARAPAAAPPAAGPVAPAPTVAPEGPVEDPWGLTAQVVEIHATAASWIEVRGPDGTIFLSKIMQPGESYRPDVGAGWTLHARDGGAFEVKLNGAPMGLLGDPGAPVLGRSVDKIASAAAGEG